MDTPLGQTPWCPTRREWPDTHNQSLTVGYDAPIADVRRTDRSWRTDGV